jgi:hypothetical protein
MSDLTRELAQRLSGKEEVLLLWHPTGNRVEVSVRDRGSGAGFSIEVGASSAMDAFHHPYAYAARRSPRRNRAETRITDG